MLCWNCGANLEEPPGGKLSFRATCDKCCAWLHCCRNCRNYKPGLANDCMVPGTDYVADRAANNFCDEFQLKGEGPAAKGDPKDVSRRLFGDEGEPPKKGFDTLFK